MPTRRTTPSQRDAEVRAKIRADTEQAAETRQAKAEAKPAQPKPPAPPTPGIVRQTIGGEGRDAPLYSDPVPVPPWAEFIAFWIERQSGPGAVVLQASNDPDAEEWNEAPYQRPRQPGPPMMTAQSEDGLRQVNVLLPGSPPPRFPQFVRVAALVSVNAETVIEFREGA